MSPLGCRSCHGWIHVSPLQDLSTKSSESKRGIILLIGSPKIVADSGKASFFSEDSFEVSRFLN